MADLPPWARGFGCVALNIIAACTQPTGKANPTTRWFSVWAAASHPLPLLLAQQQSCRGGMSPFVDHAASLPLPAQHSYRQRSGGSARHLLAPAVQYPCSSRGPGYLQATADHAFEKNVASSA